MFLSSVESGCLRIIYTHIYYNSHWLTLIYTKISPQSDSPAFPRHDGIISYVLFFNFFFYCPMSNVFHCFKNYSWNSSFPLSSATCSLGCPEGQPRLWILHIADQRDFALFLGSILIACNRSQKCSLRQRSVHWLKKRKKKCLDLIKLNPICL